MASFSGSAAIRQLLRDDYKLTEGQIKKTMDYLRRGDATFKGFKEVLKEFDIKGGTNLDPLKDTIRDFIASGTSGSSTSTGTSGSSTATPVMPTITQPSTPQVVGPLAPGVTSIPTNPLFEGVDPYSGFTPTPSPTYTDAELADLFGANDPPTYEPTPIVGPQQPVDVDPVTGTTMSLEDLIATITAGIPEVEMPEMPDFEGMLADQADAYADALAEAEAGYATMISDLEAEQAAAAEEARLRRLTELSNMAQGGQIADFKAISNAKKERGGTSQFKRSSRGLKRMPSVVNRSLSIGARNQLPGIGGTTSNYGNMPGILSQKAGSFNRRLQ